MLENDRALLDAFRRGDRDALTRVFRHYVDDVASTLRAGVVVEVDGVRSRVGSRLPEHEIEALIHETFARAFAVRARQSYDGLRPFGAWLGTIARNVLIDRARQQKRDARVLVVENIDEVAPTDDVHPGLVLEEQEIAEIIAAIHASLDELDQKIWHLRMEEQLSFRDTARALGLTEIVVRRRDTRLRAKVLDLLREKGFLTNAKVRIGSSLLSRRNRQGT